MYALVPELGDLVTFVSDLHKSVTGRIVYRSGELIRISKFTNRKKVVDYPLEPETGLFRESLGVSDIIIHSKRSNPHYSKQLSVFIGEMLEMYDASGNPIGEPGIVADVRATGNEDAILLEDGRLLNFGFIGPPSPIAVIIVRNAVETLPIENNSGAAPAEDADVPDDGLLDTVLPVALVEEIPSEERVFSDSTQREDMFVSLLMDVPKAQQKNPRIMANLYRTTDIMLAMKNSIVRRDANGTILSTAPSISYTANTLSDALAMQYSGAPISALVPVVSVKKVLYVDEATRVSEDSDVVFRPDTQSIYNVIKAAEKYTKANDENSFAMYLSSALNDIQAYVPKADEALPAVPIKKDQDVFRTRMPPEVVQGFQETGSGYKGMFKTHIQKLEREALSTIDDRGVRLLAASTFKNHKTGTVFTISPADNGAVLGHVLLSKSLTSLRAPTRSSVLLWDIAASEASRSARSYFYKVPAKLEVENQKGRIETHTVYGRSFYQMFKESLDDQRIVLPDDSVSLVELLKQRIEPCLYPINKDVVSTLDSLGMHNLELTEELFAPIAGALATGQKQWDEAFKTLRVSASEALKRPATTVYPSMVMPDSSSLLSKDTLAHPLLTTALNAYRAKEPSLADYDLALTHSLYTSSEFTLGHLWYALIGGAEPEIVTALETAYKSQKLREERTIAERRKLVAEFISYPQINTCVHVGELEKVRNISNDQMRMVAFKDLYDKYYGGVKDNSIVCNVCTQDFCCRHEVLMMNEFLNPEQRSILRKKLLMEFGGPVFEGHYICKVCGQSIQEIEYDTHLEFDSEGRPLVGRTVVEPEREDNDETADDVPIQAEVEQQVLFEGSKFVLYMNMRTLFERCGMVMDEDVYKRAVNVAHVFLTTQLPTKHAYENGPIKPKIPYESYFANSQLTLLAALVVLELQISTVHVPIPHSGCKFSRDGFPMDGSDPATAGTGALNYVECCLSSIMNDYAPWNTVSWSSESNMEKRIKVISLLVRSTLFKILSIPVSKTAKAVPIEGVTDVYRSLLDSAKAERSAKIDGVNRSLVSSRDRYPSSFRPMPYKPAQSVLNSKQLTNVAQFQADLVEAPFETVAPVVRERQTLLDQQVIGQFHEDARETTSMCCFAPFADAKVQGFGVRSIQTGDAIQKEIGLYGNAQRLLHARDPAKSSNGTHLYVPWSAPVTTSALPEADPNMYYKLFLKHCARGRNKGRIHEFGFTGVCRHCNYKMPSEFLYPPAAEIDVNGKKYKDQLDALLAQREELALQSLRDAQINVDAYTFQEIDKAMKDSKRIRAYLLPPERGFSEQLATFTPKVYKLVKTPAAPKPWEALILSGWVNFVEGMTHIHNELIKEDIPRLRALSKFSTDYQALVKEVEGALKVHFGSQKDKERVSIVLGYIGAITEQSVGNTALTNIRNALIAESEQISTGNVPDRVNATKWFHSVSKSHAELLGNIWTSLSKNANKYITQLDEYDDEEDTETLIRESMKAYSQWLGEWIDEWSTLFRARVKFNETEYRTALKWAIFASILPLLKPNSAYYTAQSMNSESNAIRFAAQWFLDTIENTYIYVQKYQLSPEKVREDIEARAEKERAMFIDKMDKKDRELRKLELMKKKYGIGDWAEGASNLNKLTERGYEFEYAQRREMNLPEFDEAILGARGQTMTMDDVLGFARLSAPDRANMNENYHREVHDEDE